MNTLVGGIGHPYFQEKKNGIFSEVGEVLKKVTLLMGLLVPNTNIGVPPPVKQAPLHTIAPEIFDDKNYKQISLPHNRVIIIVPRDVSAEFEGKALKLLDHTFAHYPEKMHSYMRLVVFQYDLRKGTYSSKMDCIASERNLSKGEKIPDVCHIADGLSFSQWGVVHLRIPLGGNSLYPQTEATTHHEMTHIISQDTRLKIHTRLLIEWKDLFQEGQSPSDSSSGRTDAYGLAYARTGPKDDQAVLAEDLFNVRGVPGWREIRKKQKESKIYREKLGLLYELYFEASGGQMNHAYWELMEKRGPHTTESYRVFFQNQKNQGK